MSFDIEIGKQGEGSRISIRIDPTEKIIESISGIISYWDIEEEIKILYNGSELCLDQKWSRTDIKEGDFVLIERKNKDIRLPKQIWESRLKNEMDIIKENDVEVIEEHFDDESFSCTFKVINTPGPVKIGSNIALSFQHIFELKIPRSYPYFRPKIRWETDIFHPNIKLPKKGGEIKIDYIENWSFSCNLKRLVEEIKNLLLNPDIERVWESRNCKEAADKYLSLGYPKPKS